MWVLVGEEKSRVDLAKLNWKSDTLPLVLLRTFNQPTNLDQESRVFLELQQLPNETRCYLNQEFVGACNDPLTEFEITTGLVSKQNQIRLEINQVANGTAAAVRLKIA